MKLSGKIVLIIILGIVLTALMLFLPAGSFGYWHAWLFMCVLFIPAIFVTLYFLKRDPAFLERRLRFKEKEAREKTIIKLSQILFFITFLIPGFDYRYGWSNVPFWLVIASNSIVFLGYLFIFYVFKVNSYASRIVEVEKDQKVITTGPYAIIRHPMYTGVLLMYFFMPVALGSYIALIPMAPILIIIILRIFDEERLLKKELKGYKEYTKKVRYRLIPGIW